MKSETIVDITEAVETNDESILEDVDFSSFVVFIDDRTAIQHLVSEAKSEVDIEKFLQNNVDKLIHYEEGKNAFYFQIELPSISGKVKRYKYKKLITEISTLKCPNCNSEMPPHWKVRRRKYDGKTMKILIVELFCEECRKSQDVFSFKIKILANLFYNDVRTGLATISKVGISKNGFIIERFQNGKGGGL